MFLGPRPTTAAEGRPQATLAQGRGRTGIPSPPLFFSPAPWPPPSSAAVPPWPPPLTAAALVAGPPRTTPAQATAGDRILPPPSLFSLTPEPPSRPEPPARAAAGEPPLPPLLCGREEGEEGKNAQSPPGLLPFYLRTLPLLCLFAKESLPFILFQNKPFPHINIILNKPLAFSRITRIISKIPIKPLPSQK